ncbi:AraC family transcriptional regulator [Filimonas effusa]|uniref:AraC family transcriptional regulator n=1 Tax=Filimonas effusa TaxID=2508721 RepID=A0A4Q1DA62_9BACT|nr:helix-turn-helix domain-containing protein [Filimonas effusa]RXK86274.1 AraC family transcriptional regulator [Filimonas effusa]
MAAKQAPIQSFRQDKQIQTMNEKDTLEVIHPGYPYRSETLALILVLGGEIHLKANLIEFVATRNNLVFVNPNKIYEFTSISKDFKMLGISFTSDFLGESGIHLGTPEVLEFFSAGFYPCFPLNDTETHSIHSMLSFLSGKLLLQQEQLYLQDVIRHSFLTLLFEAASIYRRFSSNQQVKLTRKEEITLNFLKLVGAHFRTERSVQFYADALFISARHLSQVVKEVSGKTAGEMIEDAVIQEAKVLLLHPGYNISRITQELNFSSASFFSKFFKTRTGLSPSECRTR